MSKYSLNLSQGKYFFDNILCKPEKLPFTFVYGGKKHCGFEGLAVTADKKETESALELSYSAMLDNCLKLSAVCLHNKEFGENEYTVWFENISDRDVSDTISELYCIDCSFNGDNPILRSCLGDHDNFYAAYEKNLCDEPVHFLSLGGRATHIVFPYFDLVHGNGGTMIALGWAGTWECWFENTESSVSFRAQSCVGLNCALLPHEKIRTALVVLLDYSTRNYDNATNLWREWYMKYNLPKADTEGNMLKPFSTTGWAGDTGLPNSDGSISERYFTWKPTLDRIVAENVLSDFRWFDAGWYYDAFGKTVESDWWGTVGSWELDRDKWPGDTFLQSNEVCHKLGMKVVTWFEPERVTDVEALAENYGYNPEWGIGEGRVKTNNLGNPDCLAWTLGRITKMMGENGVDMFREDNNSDPGYAWPFLDRTEADKYGIPRSGVNENKCICGHYALWDGIIDFCAKNGKCIYVDSCASGGGRNDLESMRRAFPLMRSDYDRTTSSMRLSQTSSFCRWIPFHGSTVKETANQLDNPSGKGNSVYVVRASYLPIYNFGDAFTHNPELDYDLMRRNLGEWKSIRHLLTKDMYFLTPWHHNEDRTNWTAFAYDDPEIGESIVLAFRMEDCADDSFTAKLQFADCGAEYTYTNADTGECVTVGGCSLKNEGIKITLPDPKSSVLFRIKKK